MTALLVASVGRAEQWLTGQKHSVYGIAVARMILGFVVWSQLAVNWADRHYTWGDGTEWTIPVRAAKAWPWFFGGFDQLSGQAFDAAYLGTIVAGFLLMLGIFTRASAVLTLLMWMSLYVTNPFVGSGGDAVLRMVLLYLCFTDSGRIWSVDASLAARSRSGQGGSGQGGSGQGGPGQGGPGQGGPGQGRSVRQLLPAWMSALLHNIALILIIHQIVMVYVGSAFWKLQGPLWTNGTAVYYPLQTEAFSPWGDLVHPLISWAPFVLMGSYTALIVQLFFPVMLLYRPTRFVVLVVVTGMHLGIGFGMGILYFSLAMIAVDMILVSDRSWQIGLAWVRDRTLRIRLTNVFSRRVQQKVPD